MNNINCFEKEQKEWAKCLCNKYNNSYVVRGLYDCHDPTCTLIDSRLRGNDAGNDVELLWLFCGDCAISHAGLSVQATAHLQYVRL